MLLIFADFKVTLSKYIYADSENLKKMYIDSTIVCHDI